MCNGNDIGNLVSRRISWCYSSFMDESLFRHRNFFQFIEVYVDGIVRVQHVRKLCTDFQNS